jgi:hypothetical protein
MLIREDAGSIQAESSELKAQGKKRNYSLFILSALSFQPKLQRATQLIHEIVQEKIPKLELLRNHR